MAYVKSYAVKLARLNGCSYLLQTSNPTSYSNRKELQDVIGRDILNKKNVTVSPPVKLGTYNMSECSLLEEL